jgi:capsular polysaccharide biosynthesis protein
MDLLSIIQALWRNKLFTIPVIVFTALAALYVVKIKPPVYEASASILLTNPPAAATASQIAADPKLRNASPYNTFVSYGDLSIVADSVIDLVTSGPAQPALIKSGVDPRYQIELSTDYGDPPIIDITGVGSTPKEAVLSANLLTTAAKADLYEMQVQQGIDPFFRIGAVELITPNQAQRSSSGKLRSLVAVLGLGVILLFVVISVAEAVRLRRKESLNSTDPHLNGTSGRDMARSGAARYSQGAALSTKVAANGSGSTRTRLRPPRIPRPRKTAAPQSKEDWNITLPVALPPQDTSHAEFLAAVFMRHPAVLPDSSEFETTVKLQMPGNHRRKYLRRIRSLIFPVMLVISGVLLATACTTGTHTVSGGQGASYPKACAGPANTPGGPDPWGGCFPGPENTGVPLASRLVDVDSGTFARLNGALLPDNIGWKFSTSDGYIVITAARAVIDGISDNDGIYVPPGDSLTVKDSRTGLINDEGLSLLVENSTLNGGSQAEFPTVAGNNVTVEYSDVYGGKDEVNCESDDCTVENSWLHNNYNAPESHQQGFLADGGSNYQLRHNSIYCTGGCTADISFLSDNDKATVSDNLLVASPDSAFCVYPGPNESSQTGVNDMVWTDNVFQEGAGNKCATYGPVYGWYPSDGTGNVWSGNMWADGAALDEP